LKPKTYYDSNLHVATANDTLKGSVIVTETPPISIHADN